MIVIVGAGISGLALAHELASRGRPFTVLEADTRPGGVIRSAVVDGHLLEFGPQRTRLVTGVQRLIDDLGLLDDVITAPPDLPLFVHARGRLRRVPFSVRDFLTGDLLTARARLRVLREPFTRGADPDETVAAYFTRKLGRETYANLVGPLYGGLYASDPQDMVVGLSLAGTLRQLGIGRSLLGRAVRGGGRIDPPAAISFRDGMQTLTDALYRRHAAAIRLNSPVTRIARTPRGYAVQTAAGDVQATHVVLTAPAPSTARILADCAPATAAAIANLRSNPLAIVHLVSHDTVPHGLGFQVGFGEPYVTRGVTFNDALFQRRNLYTSYLGGAQHPDVMEWDDNRIAETAAAEFRTLTGASADAVCVTRAVMPAWDRSWKALAAARASAPPGLHFCANWESRPGLPGRVVAAEALAIALTANN